MKYAPLIAPAFVALVLSGCNDADEAEMAPADDVAAVDTADDAYPVGGTMNPEQQSNFESFDREAAGQEYDTSRSAMAEESRQTMAAGGRNSGSQGGMAGRGEDASGDMAQGASGEAGPGMDAGASVPTLRPRSQMDFGFLDRNSDGQLSVGEYAIWAVRANPAKPKPEDNNRPFISTEQLNEAGKTFFYFDQDGNSYLSQSEFDAARSSARTP